MTKTESNRWVRFTLSGLLFFSLAACIATIALQSIGLGRLYIAVFLCGAFAVYSWRGPSQVLTLGTAIIQVAAWCVLLFAPIGFDQPSSLGLDSTDAVGLGVIAGAAMLAGISVAAVHRNWLGFWINLGIPGVVLLVLCSGIADIG